MNLHFHGTRFLSFVDVADISDSDELQIQFYYHQNDSTRDISHEILLHSLRLKSSPSIISKASHERILFQSCRAYSCQAR